MQRHPTVVFAGGGTGGHLFPGMAVAAELQAVDSCTRIIFAGSERTLEQQIVTSHGYEHWPLPVEPSTTYTRRPHRALSTMWQSYARARQLMRERRPDCVVGLGGFASVPVAFAARRSGVPIVLMEQNVVPGRATTLLSRFAATVCLSFPETEGPIPHRRNALVTGNPVRRCIASLHAHRSGPELDITPTLLVLGGSQGATAINDAMLAAAGSPSAAMGAWQIVHQTGPKDIVRVRETYAKLGVNAFVEPFFDDLANSYRKASLVISRAGATTLAELACAGCPALLVPYPRSLRNHQLANARWFAQRGAAEVVEQVDEANGTAARLVEQFARLTVDVSRRAAMRSAMQNLASPDAARQVADCVRRHTD